jgi:hypothetical protein
MPYTGKAKEPPGKLARPSVKFNSLMTADHYIQTDKVEIRFENYMYETDDPQEIRVLRANPRIKEVKNE